MSARYVRGPVCSAAKCQAAPSKQTVYQDWDRRCRKQVLSDAGRSRRPCFERICHWLEINLDVYVVLRVPTSCGRELRSSCRTPEGRPHINNEQRNPLDLTCVIHCWQKKAFKSPENSIFSPTNSWQGVSSKYRWVGNALCDITRSQFPRSECTFAKQKKEVKDELESFLGSSVQFSSVTGDKNCRMIRTLLIWI